MPNDKLTIASGTPESDSRVVSAKDVESVLELRATRAARKDHWQKPQDSVKGINKQQKNTHSDCRPDEWTQGVRQKRCDDLSEDHANRYARNREQQVYESKAHVAGVPERPKLRSSTS